MVMKIRSRSLFRPNSNPGSMAWSRAGPSPLVPLLPSQGKILLSTSVSVNLFADLACSFEIAEIEESCSHGVQFGGMCVHCGQDMTQ